MKSSWRSPDGGSSVARNTEIKPCGAVFCAWWATDSTPIRSFHTVSEGEFCELRLDGVLGRFVNVTAGRAVYKNAERPQASGWRVATLLREIIAKDVKTRGGRGRDLTKRMLYLPALIVAAVLMACAVVLALS